VGLSAEQMIAVMDTVFVECRALRVAGQKEYAHEDTNAFANFEDDAKESGVSRETVLTIFANKHWRGIRAWVRGHKSQRENVRGRIDDMIVYLCLLRGMADENDGLVIRASTARRAKSARRTRPKRPRRMKELLVTRD
jgi:hypothetical protein